MSYPRAMPCLALPTNTRSLSLWLLYKQQKKNKHVRLKSSAQPRKPSMKWEAITKWGKIFANYMLDKELIFKIHKELL